MEVAVSFTRIIRLYLEATPNDLRRFRLRFPIQIARCLFVLERAALEAEPSQETKPTQNASPRFALGAGLNRTCKRGNDFAQEQSSTATNSFSRRKAGAGLN